MLSVRLLTKSFKNCYLNCQLCKKLVENDMFTCYRITWQPLLHGFSHSCGKVNTVVVSRQQDLCCKKCNTICTGDCQNYSLLCRKLHNCIAKEVRFINKTELTYTAPMGATRQICHFVRSRKLPFRKMCSCLYIVCSVPSRNWLSCVKYYHSKRKNNRLVKITRSMCPWSSWRA